MPKAESRVYRSPIASNKSAEICWYIENIKNLYQPVVVVIGYYSIPAARGFCMNVRFVPKVVICDCLLGQIGQQRL